MVFIHGGAFYFGSSSGRFYGADYLVDQGVVLVTINYRLGAQG
jgi:para-nitrobenzyl esterase